MAELDRNANAEANSEASRRFDVLIVGAGPTGIAAACAAAESGARVGLADDNPVPGGQIWRGVAEHSPSPEASDWYARLERASVTHISGATIIAQPAPKVLAAECSDRVALLSYEKLVLATGARERFLPFP